MRRSIQALLAALMLVLSFSIGTPARADTPTPFTDTGGSAFGTDIAWLYAAGITNGCGPMRYCPTDPVTRDQMASFLVRMFDLPPTTGDYFADDNANLHQASINALAASGITRGCGPSSYCPTAAVTRAQMASFLAAAASLSTGVGHDYFYDDNGQIHEEDINRIAAAGISNGCGSARFCPAAAVTREQMAAFLHRVVSPIAQLPAPAPPAGGNLALGVWSGQPWEPGELNAVTALLGRAPSIFLTYQAWDRGFHASDMAEIANRGADHIVTWQPDGIPLRDIAAGQHDAFIRDWAQGAAAWGGRIYLRPMHEMNGDWYSWGRGVNGNTAADFVGAWRHMHDLFVAAGAGNVRWVWSPNVRYGPEYPLADLYPGDAYVDWVGLDGYNWGLDPHLGQPAWQSFEDIFGATYREITTAVAPGKPIVIVETASTENGGDKAAWILRTFLTDAPTYPAVRALVWFNQADGPSDFRIDSSPAALAAFRQVLNAPTYQARLP
jgi:hypothetical protein